MKKSILCLAAVMSLSTHAQMFPYAAVLQLSSKEESPQFDGSAKKMIGHVKSIPGIFLGEFTPKGQNCSAQDVVHLNVTRSYFEIDNPDLKQNKIKCTLKGVITTRGNDATFNAVCESKLGKEHNVFTLKKEMSAMELINVSSKRSEGLFVNCNNSINPNKP